MHLFFLCLFMFISFPLIFLVIFQPGKEFNTNLFSNSKESIKLLNHIDNNHFITKVIIILAFLFFVVSIILCNINNKKIHSDYFWLNNQKNIIKNKNIDVLKHHPVHTDIPH